LNPASPDYKSESLPLEPVQWNTALVAKLVTCCNVYRYMECYLTALHWERIAGWHTAARCISMARVAEALESLQATAVFVVHWAVSSLIRQEVLTGQVVVSRCTSSS
jgi:hypothetical protein